MLGIARAAEPAAGSDAMAGVLIASPEPGWPQWRGPRRDGVSDEKGLLPQWPAEGPPLLWKATGLGRGYSAPVVTGGRIHLAGDVGDDLILFTLDLQGRPVWQATNGAAWKGSWPGARASAAVRDGRLFHMNAHGQVGAFEAATGKPLWSANVLERFQGTNIIWALSECLLVDGTNVIVTAGGAKAVMAALDAATGRTVWSSEPLLLGPSTDPAHERVAEPAGVADSPAYASPILFRLGGRRHIAGLANQHAFGVDADTGRLLWTRPMSTRYRVIATTPVLWRDAVFVTAPDSEGGQLFRVRDTGAAVTLERLWTAPIDTCQHGVVVVGDRLFGPFYRDNRRWVCIDLPTGGIRYETHELAMGASIWADGRLYCLAQDGEAVLMEPGADGFRFAGRFRLVPKKVSDAWPHPVLLDARLYLRYHETLYCYDVRASR